jgi:hypothetical protein
VPASLRNKRTLLLWLFPVAIWAVATGFYGFHLGKYSDDWSQSFINPQTGHADASFHPWVRWPFFFRPLYFIVVWALNTACWEHDWARHLIAALAHFSVGICLYRLLRRIGLNRPASIAPVSIFLACPTHEEAVLWVAAIGIPIGTALFLIACERVVDFSRLIPDGRPWGRLAVIGLLIFAAACFHEQPAAAAAALPALYLACCIPNQPLWVRVRRTAFVTIFVGGACVLYATLITLTAPAGRRGSLASLVTGSNASERFTGFAREVGRWLFGDHARDAVIDAAGRGLRLAFAQPAGWLFALLLAVGLGAWFFVFPRCWARRHGHWTTRRTPWLLAFCAIIPIASLLPVAMTASNGIYSRYFYVLTLGLPLLIAILIDRASGAGLRGGPRRATPVLVALLAAAISIGGALAMVSWQGDFATRAAMDGGIGAQLAALVPDPPRSAVVVPVSIATPRDLAARAAHAIPGVLERPFAGWAFIQHIYGRDDLSATHCRADEPPPLRLVDGGLAYVYPDGWKIEVRDPWGRGIKGRTVIPWSEAILIEIDADGRVHRLDRSEAEQRLANRR